MRPAARKFALKAPQERRRWAAPILEIARAYMKDAAKFSFVHQLMRKGHRWATAVVKPNECLDPLGGCLLGGIAHAAGVVQGAREGLLTRHMLAGGKSGDRNFRMDVVGGAVVDQADLRVGDQVLPLIAAALPTPALREFSHILHFGASHRPHVHYQRQVKEPGGGHPRIAVGLAHELGANEPDAKGGVLDWGRPLGAGLLAHRGSRFL